MLRVAVVRGALQLAVMLMLSVVILTVVQRQIVMGMRTRMQLAVMLMMLMLRECGWRRRCGVSRWSRVRSVRVRAELTHVQRRRLRCSCRRRSRTGEKVRAQTGRVRERRRQQAVVLQAAAIVVMHAHAALHWIAATGRGSDSATVGTFVDGPIHRLRGGGSSSSSVRRCLLQLRLHHCRVVRRLGRGDRGARQSTLQRVNLPREKGAHLRSAHPPLPVHGGERARRLELLTLQLARERDRLGVRALFNLGDAHELAVRIHEEELGVVAEQVGDDLDGERQVHLARRAQVGGGAIGEGKVKGIIARR